MKVKVVVTLKSGVLDPQGKAIQQTLNGMGFANVKDVRQGKYFDIDIDESDEKKAKILQKTLNPHLNQAKELITMKSPKLIINFMMILILLSKKH